MALFEYERQRSDLQDKYSQDEAVNGYARFVSQQRFNRGRQDQERQFQRNFPKFTGGWAQRLGSGVQSGGFQRELGNFVGDYNRNQAYQNADFAQQEGQFELGAAQRSSAFQRAMLMLQEQIARERAAANPFV